jgi:hypothetical protein
MARSAIDAAVDSGSEHHKKFIKETVFDNRPTRLVAPLEVGEGGRDSIVDTSAVYRVVVSPAQ